MPGLPKSLPPTISSRRPDASMPQGGRARSPGFGDGGQDDRDGPRQPARAALQDWRSTLPWLSLFCQWWIPPHTGVGLPPPPPVDASDEGCPKELGLTPPPEGEGSRPRVLPSVELDQTSTASCPTGDRQGQEAALMFRRERHLCDADAVRKNGVAMAAVPAPSRVRQDHRGVVALDQ